MLKFFKVLLLVAAFILFLSGKASAHQPIVIDAQTKIEVSDPTTSKAYYGELIERPAYFLINQDKPFTLYVGILLPKIEGIAKDFSAIVYKDSRPYAYLYASKSKWVEFYEPNGGDWYYQGPEYKKEVPAGTYLIKVYNPKNEGKYVVAIGEQESFPLKVVLNTIKIMPSLKLNFFKESFVSLLFSKYGLIYWIPAVLIITIPLLIMVRIRRNSKKR
jgi:hypothetical protein